MNRNSSLFYYNTRYDGNTLLNTIEKFNPSTGNWEILDVAMTTHRCDAGVTVVRRWRHDNQWRLLQEPFSLCCLLLLHWCACFLQLARGFLGKKDAIIGNTIPVINHQPHFDWLESSGNRCAWGVGNGSVNNHNMDLSETWGKRQRHIVQYFWKYIRINCIYVCVLIIMYLHDFTVLCVLPLYSCFYTCIEFTCTVSNFNPQMWY